MESFITTLCDAFRLSAAVTTASAAAAAPRLPSVGELALPHISKSQVLEHSSVESCWIIVRDNVYDVTDFLWQHPGGGDIMLEHAGKDATWAFINKGHSSVAEVQLKQYCIGSLPLEERTFHIWESLNAGKQ